MNILNKLKQGLKDITPIQQLEANYIAALGQTVGLVCAFFTMLGTLYFKWTWTTFWFMIVVGFASLQTYTAMRGSRRQIEELKDMEAAKDEMSKLLNCEV